MKKCFFFAFVALCLFVFQNSLSAQSGSMEMQGMQHGQHEAMVQMGPGHHMAMTMVGTKNEGGMKISLMTAPAETFYIMQGETLKTMKKKPNDVYHMMVVLQDPKSGWRIPNTALWMTIKDDLGKVVFDERLWPMFAESPHYGNNVPLGDPGHYHIEVQVGVPQLARHAPYQKEWLTPFKVAFDFNYGGPMKMH